MVQIFRLLIVLQVMLLLHSCGDTAGIRDAAEAGSDSTGQKSRFIGTDVYLETTINGQRGNFLLDFGSEVLVIDSTFNAGFLHLKGPDDANVSGMGNETQNIPLIRDTIYHYCGEVKLFCDWTPILNLKVAGGDHLDGIIGSFCLEKQVVQISYDRKEVFFFSHSDSVKLEGFTKIRLERFGHYYIVMAEIKVNDTAAVKGKFIIDTGTAYSWIASPVATYRNLHKLIPEKAKWYTEEAGVGGRSDGYEFISDSVSFAGFGLTNVMVDFSIDTGGLLSESEITGIIGSNILSKFELVMDFRESVLYLKPGKKFNTPFEGDRLGFLYVDRSITKKGWIVTGFYENSEAEKLGLKTGDRIIAVNGIPVKYLSPEEQLSYFRTAGWLSVLFMRGLYAQVIYYKLQPVLKSVE